MNTCLGVLPVGAPPAVPKRAKLSTSNVELPATTTSPSEGARRRGQTQRAAACDGEGGIR